MPKMPRRIETDHRHEAFKFDVLALIQKHEPQLREVEMLAIASKIVGALCAAQDQRKFTSQAVMMTVQINIEIGNQEFITDFLNKPAGNA